MKTIKKIYSDKDMDKFSEECGYFLGGSDGLLAKNHLPSEFYEYKEIKDHILFSLVIFENTDKQTILDLEKYLNKNIALEKGRIKNSLEEIQRTKAKIEKYEKNLKKTVVAKTFPMLFDEIIN